MFKDVRLMWSGRYISLCQHIFKFAGFFIDVVEHLHTGSDGSCANQWYLHRGRRHKHCLRKSIDPHTIILACGLQSVCQFIVEYTMTTKGLLRGCAVNHILPSLIGIPLPCKWGKFGRSQVS